MSPLYDQDGRDLSGDLDLWITGHHGEDDPANREEEPERPALEDLADLAYDRAIEREDDNGV